MSIIFDASNIPHEDDEEYNESRVSMMVQVSGSLSHSKTCPKFEFQLLFTTLCAIH